MTDMQTIVNLARQRGFVYPGSDIYGGLANSWDYGPLGAQMRMNLKKDWWKTFVEQRLDMVGLDGAILMNPRVWEASGHVGGFNDPLVEDTVTHKRYRADHLIEEQLKMNVDGKPIAEIDKIIKENKLLSPEGNPLTDAKQFSLMFETGIGITEGDKHTVYLRPETAQAMFVNFKNVLETSRKRLPFGIGQIGKAFRNEITPGNFTYRTLEFEQMEIEYFVIEEEWEKHFEAWAKAMEDWAESIGLDRSKLHRLEVEQESLAHYSKRTIDFEYEFPFGTKELWGLAYRTDFDLKNHSEQSGTDLIYRDPEDNTKTLIPHVVEPTFGVDRTILALLVNAYHEEDVEGEKRVVLKLAKHIAPIQIAVLPLSKKDELSGPAKELVTTLSKNNIVEYDETQSIGRRYRRQDEIGTPYCVTVDFETLEDKAVTIRDRDTMEQERVAIDELPNYFAQKFAE